MQASIITYWLASG
ncbi:hypothetical protein DEALK_19170 [Dehalogenimonas alkenigignens]|uniref:Uncharacterized protein n=1 Tax=Dehalogenimonas alkenigignens TaxID=1217799 RepID=A0A0W0GKI9_9CHLR|nr:hypothetical protein DEALK_19170 [Dehalogenimonas alkenigignens]